MLKSVIALVLLFALAAILVVVGASPPAVGASSPPPTPTPHGMDRCDSPTLAWLGVDGVAVILDIEADDRFPACWRPAFVELSYGTTTSANAYRHRQPFPDPRRTDSDRILAVDIRNFKLGGSLYLKARTITGAGELSWWSSPTAIELPERPDPLPTPVVSAEPTRYDRTTPWVAVSWTNLGDDADKVEVEAYDAEGRFLDGDRTGESGIRYRPYNGSSAMKFRVRSLADGRYSDWSRWAWAYSRRSD